MAGGLEEHGRGGRTGAVRLTAPAKLTRSLRVVGRRTDGYHELVAEMVAVDLADTLHVDPGGEGLTIDADDDARAAGLRHTADNMVLRALAAAGVTAGVHLVKRIPVRGGLGGGSSDAAAVLRWSGRTDPKRALGLGSDVPFCVVGGRATVTGVGESVEPLPFEPRSFVLLVPPFGTDTAAVFRAHDYLGSPTADGPNDLLAAALTVEPRLARWRDLLGEVAGREPLLAGSGSTWFLEGTRAELGLLGRTTLNFGQDSARLISASAVPAGWEGWS